LQSLSSTESSVDMRSRTGAYQLADASYALSGITSDDDEDEDGQYVATRAMHSLAVIF